MPTCVFCEVAKDSPNQLFNDGLCYVVFDIHPAAEEHLLIISNEHYENMLATPDDIMEHMFLITKKFYKIVWEELHPTGGTVVTNRGPGHVDHFHIHIIPRYKAEKQVTLPRMAFNDAKKRELTERLKSKI